MLCELRSVSFKIWTRVAVSTSYDNDHYTTGTSNKGVRNLSQGCLSESERNSATGVQTHIQTIPQSSALNITPWQYIVLISLSWYRQKNGMTLNEIHEKMVQILAVDTPIYATVKKWAAEFKWSRDSKEDDPSSGHLKTLTTYETGWCHSPYCFG